MKVVLDGRRCRARTCLTANADLACKALGIMPPLHVTELPRLNTDPREECCGTRDPYASKLNNHEGLQMWGVKPEREKSSRSALPEFHDERDNPR